ncbi:MAG: enoyl-CoA hydratase-related protein [Desulfobacteraceae bacterium]|jgi:enoyl-CoA hydratase/carnithine racemase
MTYETILVEREHFVGFVTLNRPEQLNTFTSQLARDLCAGLVELDNDTEVRVIVLRGAGKAFCCGIELSEFHGKSQKEYREWIALMERVIPILAYMKKPVIASAHGYAVANGAGLIASCDLAVVEEGIKIGLTAVNVGLFCMGPAVPVSRSLGRKRTLELLMTGDMIDAAKALEWGLVNRVAPEGKLHEETMALAEKLAVKSPLAIQMGKQAYYGMADLEYGKGLAYTNELFAALCMTEDAPEGIDAFLNRREPEWKGR